MAPLKKRTCSTTNIHFLDSSDDEDDNENDDSIHTNVIHSDDLDDDSTYDDENDGQQRVKHGTQNNANESKTPTMIDPSSPFSFSLAKHADEENADYEEDDNEGGDLNLLPASMHMYTQEPSGSFSSPNNEQMNQRYSQNDHHTDIDCEKVQKVHKVNYAKDTNTSTSSAATSCTKTNETNIIFTEEEGDKEEVEEEEVHLHFEQQQYHTHLESSNKENFHVKPDTCSTNKKSKLKRSRSKSNHDKNNKDNNKITSIPTAALSSSVSTEAETVPTQIRSLKVIVNNKRFVVQDVHDSCERNHGHTHNEPIVLDQSDYDQSENDERIHSIHASASSKPHNPKSSSSSSSTTTTNTTTTSPSTTRKRRKRQNIHNNKNVEEEESVFEKATKKVKQMNKESILVPNEEGEQPSSSLSKKEKKKKKISSSTMSSKVPTAACTTQISPSKIEVKSTSSTSKSSSSISTNAATPTITPNQPTTNTKTTTSTPSITTTKKKQTFQNQVLIHLLKTLKPFTLKSLASELRTTSIALNHLMLSMIDKKIIKKKEWGKNKNKELYYIDIHNAMKEVNGKDYQNSIDVKMKKEDARDELNILKQKEMKMEYEMNTIKKQMSNDELENQIVVHEKIVNEMKSRIDGAKERISNTNINNNMKKGFGKTSYAYARSSVSMKQQQHQQKSKVKTTKQIKQEFNEMRNQWKSRKEKCMDFIDNLSDALEKRPKDVIKLLELETDESTIGCAKLPPKHTL